MLWFKTRSALVQAADLRVDSNVDRGGKRAQISGVERYEAKSGDSGVVGFQFTNRGILVQFEGGSIYLYDEDSAGRENVAEMKRRARDGRGLATFISQHVHDRYSKQI